IEKGPGDNLHVELTDIAFGPPVIEREAEQWRWVWIPVYPAGSSTTATNPAVILKANGVHEQAQLDALLKQPRLEALATTPLADHSVWKVKVSKELRQAYPKLDASKVIFLTEPDLYREGKVVLPGDVALDPTTAWVAWGAAAGLLVVGIVCLLLKRRR